MATSVCVGGGLVGGLFAPSLFLGALVRQRAGSLRKEEHEHSWSIIQGSLGFVEVLGPPIHGCPRLKPSFPTPSQVGDILGHFVATPWSLADPTSLVVVGAAAVLGAACRAPLTAIALMVGLRGALGSSVECRGGAAARVWMAQQGFHGRCPLAW